MSSQQLDLLKLYEVALRIRLVEEEIAKRYPEGQMRCPVHLSIGQESTSAVFSQIQRQQDTAISTHRAHAHYLAKQGNLQSMIAEIYGKITGCSKGRGGSMHLIDLSVNFLGSSAIVGNSIPIGVGSAFAHKLEKNNSVSFVFIGDAAIEEGVFYESANFAAIHKLPVVFICENNLYSVYTGLEPRQPLGRSISQLASAIGLKSERVDSFDYRKSFEVLNELTSAARKGEGPSFIELATYRVLEHCGPNDDDDLGYRPEEELIEFKHRDVINEILKDILLEKLATEKELALLKERLVAEVSVAFIQAINDPFPSLVDVMSGVYAE
jgi:pyruvate dehydrogenase E1 component alpha subunit